MKFKLTNLETIDEAKGLVIVIDVLRAFSTTCYLFHNKCKTIIPVETIEQAIKLKENNPDYILLGERHGKPIPNFDHSNSPTEIKKINFSNKTVVMTTTAGTKGIVRSVNAEEIITGSFVNSGATINYIQQKKPDIVSFVCTDSSFYDNEDYMYAKYIQKYLEGKSLNFKDIKKHLEKHKCTDGFLKKPLTEFSRNDFNLCMKNDKFDFIIKVSKHEGDIFLNKI
ncbi:MAG: 2-phosphosulfolactate phosphatase [Candidatus Roizmanbacteria bacterium GW2011_GWC2_35_12]|uniref:Probable 2-phosphosulfolactate phosphatase n=2 Tax=Candidatus Roizmaniibacteriota TaxID=1752723 RepID=A0A0G0BCU0_9BACT|nr:MAG: 2-phosphosulfolactate phosphatase [Candidatus Roizmanbacteria bacterium GW2011_GWA2_32_13]KKP66036.1 MAG: 2-phosphosulfolactate phosphatase [Candidatus Roizmanbacteria bacterium GW2011_GWC2_35_12]